VKNLRIIRLQNNCLTWLPNEIGGLSSLVSLNLNGNKLASIPPEIGKLPNLNVLYLAYNQLTEVPEEFWELKGVESLELMGGNRFVESVEDMKALRLKVRQFLPKVGFF